MLDLPYGLCDRLSKLIPVVQNKPLSLSDARDQEPQISELMNDSSDGESIQELWSLAEYPRGPHPRRRHARRRVLIAREAHRLLPALHRRRRDATLVSPVRQDDVEAVGLVKFDFLGLRNLTIIELALEYVPFSSPASRPDLMSLGFEDQAAYQILREPTPPRSSRWNRTA